MSRVPDELRPGGEYDRFVADRAGADQFSGSVLLTCRGRTVLERSYGLARKGTGVPNTPDTLFDLASITKLFTAVAVTQLVQQGKVALHEKLGTYLDGFRPKVAEVTVHHLLTHTSGLGGSGTSGKDSGSVDETWNSAMANVREAPLEFTPGTRFAYSNSGFLVLGAIVAAVSGLSYYDYVRQNIFVPAGMTRSAFYTRPKILAANDIARRYATDPESGERREVTPGFVGLPNHGAYSSVRELARFLRALADDTLLDPDYVRLIGNAKTVIPPKVKPDIVRDGLYYGYGAFHTIVNRQRLFGHSGSARGVANMLDRFPGSGWTSVVLSNYDTPVEPIVNLARRFITQ